VSAVFDFQYGRYFYDASKDAKRTEQEASSKEMERIFDEYGK
jgi:hypothetical protein